jgi:Holliday junction resolvasome RuvABC endonuclease subunit
MAEHEPCIGATSEWFTPKFIFDALGLEFDLDPAHPGRNNPFCVVPARRIFTAQDDGLQQPWIGLTWLNPPFGGRRGQVPWLQKFFAHGDGGVALVAARTSSDWFHEVVVPRAQSLLFPNGKTKFTRVDGTIGKEPGTGVVLIGMGEIANRALERSGLGCFVDNTAGPLRHERSDMDSGASVVIRPLGVDPGIHGGLAVIEIIDGTALALIDAIDIPVAGIGAKERVDILTIRDWILTHQPQHAFIERAQAMPKQGASSGFKYGRAVGAIEAVIACCAIPLTTIEPTAWKKFHHLRGGDKEGGRQRAVQLFPAAHALLARKKDHGRAEAALIALAGIKRYPAQSPLPFPSEAAA